MPVMDEFKEERASIRTASTRQKYQYFKDYYRTPLIIVICVVAFAGILLYQFVTKKDSAFYAAMLNCSPYPDNEWFEEGFLESAGIDKEQYDITLDTAVYLKLNSTDEDSMITIQKIETYSGGGTLDVLMGGGDAFAYYANSVALRDLREFMTEEQLAKYQDSFYYIDLALQDKLQEYTAADEVFDWSAVPDPRKPEEMEDPVPVAVYVDSSEKLGQAYYFKNAENGVAMGMFANSSHPDHFTAFLDYLFE